MRVDAATAAADEKELSIEEMEAGIKANPNDTELKKDLSNALLFRYLYGADDAGAGDKKDLKRLRGLVKEMTEPVDLLPRAYLCYLDKQYDEAVKWLTAHASRTASAGETPTCDESYAEFFCPFSDAKPAFWTKLSEAMDDIFPGSAASYYIHAIASAEDTDIQASYYKQALDTDNTYWSAAWALGNIYRSEKNWQSALMFYQKALPLQCESQVDFSELHFQCAWCLSKLKRHQEEEEHLRECLKLDPGFESARNNLGVSLLKQGKYEEALAIFEELFKLGLDGKYPVYNRARCLKALKRYDEAIAAWRAASPSGKLPNWVTDEIFKIQRLINVQASRDEQREQQAEEPVEKSMAGEDADLHADEDDGAIAPEENLVSDDEAKGKKGRAPGVRAAAPKEAMLEEHIEKQITEGESVFERKLKMYQSPEGLYGRQFTVPCSDIARGRIDLLAEDIESGDLVVIELKRDKSHEVVVGQISMYMTWVRENLAKKNQNVVGLIVVSSASPKLLLAARNIPGLEVHEYNLGFARVT